MKIAIAQMEVFQGNYQRNQTTMVTMIDQAMEEKAQCIVFPMACLQGYDLQQQFYNQQWMNKTIQLFEAFKQYSIMIVFGHIFLENGKLIKKTIVLHEGKEQHYDGNEVEIDGIVITLDDSVWTQETILLPHNCNYHMVVRPVSFTNRFKACCLYHGGSFFSKNGEIMKQCAQDFKQQLLVVSKDDNKQELTDKPTLMKALVYAVKSADEKWFNKQCPWIIGLSGGLDSTINACLLTIALGSDRVIGYNMASKYNSQTTKNNACKTAEKLGIRYHDGSIEDVVEATDSTLVHYGYQQATGLVLENIQARIRGHLLSTFAAIEKGVVINNGNKVETALGYCTMYGDSIGALSLLADCTKVECFRIAREINDYFNDEVVPYNLLPEVTESTITWLMPPSAELKDGQRDPMKWFYHDAIIERYLKDNDDGYSIRKDYYDNNLKHLQRWITYYGLDDAEAFEKDFQWLVSTIKKAAFKRIQTPPIVKVSTTCYGYDIVESQ